MADSNGRGGGHRGRIALVDLGAGRVRYEEPEDEG